MTEAQMDPAMSDFVKHTVEELAVMDKAIFTPRDEGNNSSGNNTGTGKNNSSGNGDNAAIITAEETTEMKKPGFVESKRAIVATAATSDGIVSTAVSSSNGHDDAVAASMDVNVSATSDQSGQQLPLLKPVPPIGSSPSLKFLKARSIRRGSNPNSTATGVDAEGGEEGSMHPDEDDINGGSDISRGYHGGQDPGMIENNGRGSEKAVQPPSKKYPDRFSKATEEEMVASKSNKRMTPAEIRMLARQGPKNPLYSPSAKLPPGSKSSKAAAVAATQEAAEEEEVSSTAKNKRLTSVEMRQMARQGPRQSIIKLPIIKHKKVQAAAGKNNENIDNSSPRTGRSSVSAGEKKKKKKPLYLRMIQQAHKKEIEEEMKKNEEYLKFKEAKAKLQLNKEQLREHMRKYDALTKQQKEAAAMAAEAAEKAAASPPGKKKRSSISSPLKQLDNPFASVAEKKAAEQAAALGFDMKKEDFKAKNQRIREERTADAAAKKNLAYQSKQRRRESPRGDSALSVDGKSSPRGSKDNSPRVAGSRSSGSNKNSPRTGSNYSPRSIRKTHSSPSKVPADGGGGGGSGGSGSGGMNLISSNSEVSPKKVSHNHNKEKSVAEKELEKRPAFNLYTKAPPALPEVFGDSAQDGSSSLHVDAAILQSPVKRAQGSPALKRQPLHLSPVKKPLKGGPVVVVPSMGPVPDDLNEAQTKAFASNDWIVHFIATDMPMTMRSDLQDFHDRLFPETE